jgi:Zn-dependent protease
MDYDDAWDEPARITFSWREALDLTLSVVVLSVAFALVLIGMNYEKLPSLDVGQLLAMLPIAAVIVVPAFILHELAHKIVAQRRDMWAEFRANPFGLVAGIVIPALTGFLFAAPGAVEIVGHADKRDAGVISIVGPLVNVALAAIALVLNGLFRPIPIGSFGSLFEIIALLNVILAGFNMLPIGPLDGRKVFRWSVLGFVGMWAIIAGLGWLYYIRASVF